MPTIDSCPSSAYFSSLPTDRWLQGQCPGFRPPQVPWLAQCKVATALPQEPALALASPICDELAGCSQKQELVVVVLLSDEHADLGKHHTVCEHGQKDARNRDGLG
ncbi:hypothetical protein TURU_045371 [Turdus rufiventris]|nr:hypothetical protein TURU_045371 [Turdus rufiventris]